MLVLVDNLQHALARLVVANGIHWLDLPIGASVLAVAGEAAHSRPGVVVII